MTVAWDASDPWRGAAMAHHAAVTRAAGEIAAATALAMERFLAAARRGVLDHGPGVFLDGWPQDRVWFDLVAELILPAVGAAWDRAYSGPRADFRRGLFLEQVARVQMTKAWPHAVFAAVQEQVTQGRLSAATPEQVRAAVGTVLALDAPTKAQRAAMTADVRGAAKAALAKLKGVWRAWAQRIAWTLGNAADNEAEMASLLDTEVASGVPQMKRWVAISDGKDSDTRPWHKAAHGQVVPVAQPFLVKGEQLMYPGDPSASGENVINCRCTVVPA